MYQTGKGVKVKLDKAMQLFGRALELGHADSQLEITKLESYRKSLREPTRVAIDMDFESRSVKSSLKKEPEKKKSSRDQDLKSPLEKIPKKPKIQLLN